MTHAIMLALINNQTDIITDIITDIMEKIRNMNIFTPFIYNESLYNESMEIQEPIIEMPWSIMKIYNESMEIQEPIIEMPSSTMNLYDEMNQYDYIICITLILSIYLLYYIEMQNTKINNMKDKMKQYENEFTKISRQIKRVNNIINTYYD